MSSSSFQADARILPVVRNLKEHSNKVLSQISQKEEKKFDNSAKFLKLENKAKIMENKNIIENEKNKNDEKKRYIPKDANKNKYYNSNKANTMIRKSNTNRISIDSSVEAKIKSNTSEAHRNSLSQNKKITIVSREKNKYINPTNTFQLTSSTLKTKGFNNIKTKSKYVQNLLNDASLKKYKNSCIDLLKNDNVLKKLYEQCGFEKTNYSYDFFIQNNFFNKPLFMYKLEMLFLDDSNFNKKNFKEIFFKDEIVKYLTAHNDEYKYKNQMNNLNEVIKQGFDKIYNFDLFQ